MSTGIVTTTDVTDASPSGTYAHVANRAFQSDTLVKLFGHDPETCHDIAKQLMLQSPGTGINVILGGGRAQFTPFSEVDPEYPLLRGGRGDGHNFPLEWLESKASANQSAKYITSRDELLEVDVENTDYLFGLFAPGNMAFLDKQEAENDPSLAEMTEVAIKILSKNPKGFYLFVEGKLDCSTM